MSRFIWAPLLLILFSCSKPQDESLGHVTQPKLPKRVLPFVVENAEISNSKSADKYQIRAYLKEGYSDSLDLDGVCRQLHKHCKDSFGFDRSTKRLFYNMQLFRGRETARRNVSWIAKCSNSGPNQSLKVQTNRMVLEAIQKHNSDQQRVEEAFKLDELLKSKGSDLCSAYFAMLDIEDEAISLADKKYPQYGEKHQSYYEQLLKDKKQELRKTLALSSSQFLALSKAGWIVCG